MRTRPTSSACRQRIAKHTAAGWEATVVALSYGERGEFGQTVERVKEIRDAEARGAAEAVGATFVPYDLGDYPLELTSAVVRRLADLMVDAEPDDDDAERRPGRREGVSCRSATAPDF